MSYTAAMKFFEQTNKIYKQRQKEIDKINSRNVKRLSN